MSDRPLGPPPVEPMSDVAWARVERGVWSRLDDGSSATDAVLRTPRRRTWVLGILAAAAVVIAVFAGWPRAGIVTSEPSEFAEPSRVVAGSSPTSVSFAGAHIEVAADAAIVMDRRAETPIVVLERGVARFAVAPRPVQASFVVRAGDAVIRVVGTQFEVIRDEERIEVGVTHGVVEVEFRGHARRVVAGQRWASTAPTEIVTTNIQAPATVASAAPDEASVAPPAPSPSIPPSPSIRSTPPSIRSTPPASTATTRMATLDAERTRYEALTALEVRQPEVALAGYLELARGDSRWAAVALFAACRLSADRRDPRAPTFLKIYLRRFPAGANARDARTLLDRIQGPP